MRHKSNAKKPLCQGRQETSAIDSPEKYLTQAVKQLIAAAETPGNLLEFLTHALSIIHQNEGEGKAIDSARCPHWGVLRMIEYLAQPWYENQKNAAGYMAAALSELVFAIGDEDIRDTCGALLIAFGIDYKTGFMSLPALGQRLRILNAMCLMVPYVREFTHAKGRQEKKEEKEEVSMN